MSEQNEQGAHTIAMYYGAPHGLRASSPGGWCYRHRRPLFALLLLVASLTYATKASGQAEVGGVRLSALAYPEGSDVLYVMLEYRGSSDVAMAERTAMILSAKSILQLSARAISQVSARCDSTGCVYSQRALFPVTPSELHMLAESSTAAVVIVTPERTFMGRLDFAHLAPIRRFVQSLQSKRAT